MAAAMAIRASHFMGQKTMPLFAAMPTTDSTNCCSRSAWTAGKFLLRHQIGGWFNDNVEVQAYVATLIILMTALQSVWRWSAIHLCQCASRHRRGKPMVLYAFIAYFVISLPLGYNLGFPCAWDCWASGLPSRSVLTIAGEMYRRRFEKELKKIEKMNKQVRPKGKSFEIEKVLPFQGDFCFLPNITQGDALG